MKTVFWQLYCNGHNGFMHIEVKDEPETLAEYKAGKGGIRVLTIEEAAREGVTLPVALQSILGAQATKLAAREEELSQTKSQRDTVVIERDALLAELEIAKSTPAVQSFAQVQTVSAKRGFFGFGKPKRNEV